MSLVEILIALLAGGAVGFTLGLVGGGGSILAVPLMMYGVGVADPHVAIGTSALAVAANAALNLRSHASAGHVKWRCALVFTATGVLGALAGSVAGKAMDGQKLLALFALVMLVVAALMLRARASAGDATVTLNRRNLPRLLAGGGATGLLSGFFGIGGGFLIVPGLMAATGMPILYAIGSSLVAVTAFGLTTSVSYALSGKIALALAGWFIAGGFIGGLLGSHSAQRLSAYKGLLNKILAGIITLTAVYMLYRATLS